MRVLDVKRQIVPVDRPHGKEGLDSEREDMAERSKTLGRRGVDNIVRVSSS